MVSCTPGKSQLSQRLLRQFCILSIPDPSASSLLSIYQAQLGRFFSDYDFNVDIKSQLLSLVSASIVIYYRVFLNMLPTPNKSHYIFNLRDLNKLIKGLMQASPIVVLTKENLVDLFFHECTRVFNDRFITLEDNELFMIHLNQTINDYFRINLKNNFKSKQQKSKDEKGKDHEEIDNIFLYADFMKNEDRLYQKLTNWKQIVSILSEYQMRSNMSGLTTKQIVFFREAVEHICR